MTKKYKALLKANPEYLGYNDVLRMLIHLGLIDMWMASRLMKKWLENKKAMI